MILGIADKLSEQDASRQFGWINFKKYYQRIIYKTGAEYKEWLSNKDKDGNLLTNYIHIVGHSLGSSDYETLYEIFNAPNSKMIVYYYSEQDFENKVQSVIALLGSKDLNGRDELIRRVYGEDWSIKFVDQYDEIDGLFH